MKTYRIAVIPGDGTGPEVTSEAVKVVEAAAEKHGFKLDLAEYDLGAERYMKTSRTQCSPSSARSTISSSVRSAIPK